MEIFEEFYYSILNSLGKTHSDIKVYSDFERKHNKMQETSNNCFESKKCCTTLRQAITGKHECRNTTTTYKTQIQRQDFNLLKIFLKNYSFSFYLHFYLFVLCFILFVYLFVYFYSNFYIF